MSTAAQPKRAQPPRRTAKPAVAPPAAVTVTTRATQVSTTPVEDVQSRADTRQIPINRVGIKDIRHPVRVKDRSRGEQHTVASFNMYVNLPHNFKGTHMSRFVRSEERRVGKEC